VLIGSDMLINQALIQPYKDVFGGEIAHLREGQESIKLCAS
jgi:hypothetical protein